RNPELAVSRGDPQVGVHRHRKAAAQAEAADARDHRLGKRQQLVPPDAGDLVVFALRVGVGAILLELADIRAGYERLVAGPGEHDDADGPVLLELIQDLTQADPHFHGNGVALFRLVEGDETD